MRSQWQPKIEYFLWKEELGTTAQPEQWERCEIHIDGQLASRGECPCRPPYSVENVAEKTAIARAQHELGRLIARDVRDNIVVGPPPETGGAGEGRRADAQPIAVDWDDILARPEW